MLLADRGYDADWIRALASQQGAWANIPPKRNRKGPICVIPYLYRARKYSHVRCWHFCDMRGLSQLVRNTL
jgi:transposase